MIFTTSWKGGSYDLFFAALFLNDKSCKKSGRLKSGTLFWLIRCLNFWVIANNFIVFFSEFYCNHSWQFLIASSCKILQNCKLCFVSRLPSMWDHFPHCRTKCENWLQKRWAKGPVFPVRLWQAHVRCCFSPHFRGPRPGRVGFTGHVSHFAKVTCTCLP